MSAGEIMDTFVTREDDTFKKCFRVRQEGVALTTPENMYALKTPRIHRHIKGKYFPG